MQRCIFVSIFKKIRAQQLTKQIHIMRKSFLFTLLFIAVSASTFAQKPLTSKQIDALVENTISTFDVPGIAVAIVKDGKIIHEKGYGLSSLNNKQKVDEHTRFGIASNSKAFTATALAMLIDDGKLNWDDRVRKFIPEFTLYDSYVSDQFTVRDLLTHRSGLGLGAGDLMLWPDSSSYSTQDIIRNLRHLKPVSDFRTQYDYDNLLYIVAGEVVEKVSGISWNEFIQTRILNPLQMTESAPNFALLSTKQNVVDPHVDFEGKVQVVRRDWREVAGAAAGIYSSVHDMSKWAIMQLNDGKYGNTKLFSEQAHHEMWTPQTIIPVRGKTTYKTNFRSYGLGWFLNDENGYKVVSHTGGLFGMVTQFTLIPELNLGIIVFTNQQSGAAFTAITNSIKDGYYGVKGKNRVKQYHESVVKNQKEAEEITSKIFKEIEAQKNAGACDLKNIEGIYNDAWFGDAIISNKNGKFRFQAINSPRLTGEMLPYKGNTYIVKWDDRSYDADAFVKFELNFEGVPTGMTMKAISPLTDFSFDFHDLDFKKKE